MNNSTNNKSNGVWMCQSVSTNRYFLTWACRGRPPSPGRASPGNTSVSLITGEVQDHPPLDTRSRCSLVSSDDPRRFVLVSRRLAPDGTALIFLLFIVLPRPVLGWRCLQQCCGEPRPKAPDLDTYPYYHLIYCSNIILVHPPARSVLSSCFERCSGEPRRWTSSPLQLCFWLAYIRTHGLWFLGSRCNILSWSWICSSTGTVEYELKGRIATPFTHTPVP